MDKTKLFISFTVKQELEDTLPYEDKSVFGSINPILLPKDAGNPSNLVQDVSTKLALHRNPLKLEPNIDSDELGNTLPYDDKSVFDTINPVSLPKGEGSLSSSPQDASTKLEFHCHPLKPEPNIDLDCPGLQDTLPYEEKNLFATINPILSPKDEGNVLNFSEGASVKLEPHCNPLKLEPNIDSDGNVLPVSTYKNNDISKQEFGTPSMADHTRMCPTAVKDMNGQFEMPRDIHVFAENSSAKKEVSAFLVASFPREDTYNGKVCRKSFPSIRGSNANMTNGKKSFECDVCNKVFEHISRLSLHRRRHTGEKPYKCEICRKSFTSSSNLSSHRKIHTGEKPFNCSICKKRFTSGSHLSRHQMTHTREKPFECDICKKRFNWNYDLSRHQRIHNVEKPFECNICKRRFKFSSYLSSHQRTHTGEKPYKCEICKKCFTSSSNLSFHTKFHTGEKSSDCSVCKKHFTSSSLLSRHQRTHTGEKPFKCDICNKRFSRGLGLSLHQRTHSQGKPFMFVSV